MYNNKVTIYLPAKAVVLATAGGKVKMRNKVKTVKITGPAGMGLKTSGIVMSRILLAHGFDTNDYVEYPSLIRGGHNTYQVSFCGGKISAPYFLVDLLFSLKVGHWEQHIGEFKKETLVFGDEKGKLTKGKFLELPLSKMIKELGHPLVGNAVCLGVVVFVFGFEKKLSEKVITDYFGKKAVINIKAFRMGYEFAREKFGKYQKKVELPKKAKKLELYDGSEAFGWGFLAGGGNFYAAYPMTPSSGLLGFLASKQKEYEVIVELPEDEIAVANIAAGAAFGGARAAVGTSGGGFALMNECVSFCGLAEIGLVFYVAMRVGPATGMPTWTAQGDLLYTIFSGHGEFPKIVMAPGDHEESFEMGWKSLNLADDLQTPVLVLSDKFLAEGTSGTEDLGDQKVKIDRGELVDKVLEKYFRYETKFKCGRSPRTIPGVEGGAFLANSYEHDKTGLSTEDAGKASEMAKKRMRKLKTANKLTPKPVLYGAKNPKRLIVSWGSNKASIIEAMRLLDDDNLGYLHIKTLWPLHSEVEEIINNAGEVVVVEANQMGQLAMLLAMVFGIKVDKKILKFDGRPFFPEELYEQFGKI